MAATSRSEGFSRSTTIILVVLLGCLLSSVRIAIEGSRFLGQDPDKLTRRSDERFAALKARLPPRGVVGYLGEPGNTGTEDYYLTQYALAPVIVVKSQYQPELIGNFPSARPETLPSGIEIIGDFGNGVLLLGGPLPRNDR